MEVSSQLHTPATLPQLKQSPHTHWTGGVVSSRAGMDAVDKRKISFPARNHTLVVKLADHCYTKISCIPHQTGKRYNSNCRTEILNK
jgi:hypothetical protein